MFKIKHRKKNLRLLLVSVQDIDITGANAGIAVLDENNAAKHPKQKVSATFATIDHSTGIILSQKFFADKVKLDLKSLSEDLKVNSQSPSPIDVFQQGEKIAQAILIRLSDHEIITLSRNHRIKYPPLKY